MDLEKIEGLVKIIEDSSLNEFTYKDKDVKITMSKLDHPKKGKAVRPDVLPSSYAGLPGFSCHGWRSLFLDRRT